MLVTVTGEVKGGQRKSYTEEFYNLLYSLPNIIRTIKKSGVGNVEWEKLEMYTKYWLKNLKERNRLDERGK
jgi:hypothetical protein